MAVICHICHFLLITYPRFMNPTEGLLAVYARPQAPFELRLFPLRDPHPDEVLVRVRMCTICRSDIHSYLGHRPNPTPGVLGHEIIGSIVALGAHIRHDMRGHALQVGDRVTWSEYFVPSGAGAIGESHPLNTYFSDVLDMPQKSTGVDKYGHMAAATPPHHHGGFGQFCYILPKSWILRLPDELSDEEATPLNCGVATMMAVTEAAEIGMGDAVVIQGLGLLGLYGAAIAKTRGARRVIGIDTVPNRRAFGLQFGCDEVIDPNAHDDETLIQHVRDGCAPAGADVVLEVCGRPEVIPLGLQMARIGGRCVWAGVVNPNSTVALDANIILRKWLTLRGVHNYHPRHLLQALDFVMGHRHRFPFGMLVDGKYPLHEVAQAIHDAAQHKVLRAAIVP